MHILTNDYIKKHYYELICSYGPVDVSKIKSYADFVPETFFVKQKRNGTRLIYFQDLSYKEWVLSIIQDVCRDLPNGVMLNTDLLNCIYENVEKLLSYKNIASDIANQEFVDVIRKIISYTLYGDAFVDVDMSNSFNNLAKNIMPFVVDIIKQRNLEIDQLLIYSILSGLSGLDLKGAPAASSNYTNIGIPMKDYFNITPQAAAECFVSALDEKRKKCTLGIFDYNYFWDCIKTKKQLVWMTDDYIESFFDLIIIEKILSVFPINISIIPKNGHYGNDMCYEELLNILDLDVFSSLKMFIQKGRLNILSHGPKMGAANINKFSYECVKLIEQADALFMKGCRIHEMLQGGLNIETFSSYVVVRQLSEITSGFKSSDNTVLFFHSQPNEYSFFGTKYEDIMHACKNLSNPIYHSVSTIREHFERKNSSSIDFIVSEFSRLSKLIASYSGNIVPLYKELEMLAKKIEAYTTLQYDKTSCIYQNLSRSQINSIDMKLWNALFAQIEVCISKDIREISLLDVGTGDGKALEFLSKLGIKATGLDSSIGFIDILKKKQKNGLIPDNSFVVSNMCNIPFEDSTYDVVRMNASLLHLPLIDKGYTADLAVSEANRVLKTNGLLFVLVKKGEGLQLIDTGEQLGTRVYQMYSHELLDEVLSRNGFITIEKFDEIENRQGTTIDWIAHIAQKR